MHLIKSLLTQQLQGMMILPHSRINLQPFSQIFHLKMHNSVFKQAEVELWMKALKAEPCAPLIPHVWSYGGGSFPDPCCDDALQKHLFQLEFICSVLPFPKEPTCCKELFNSSGLIPKKPTLGTHLSKAAEKKALGSCFSFQRTAKICCSSLPKVSLSMGFYGNLVKFNVLFSMIYVLLVIPFVPSILPEKSTRVPGGPKA